MSMSALVLVLATVVFLGSWSIYSFFLSRKSRPTAPKPTAQAKKTEDFVADLVGSSGAGIDMEEVEAAEPLTRQPTAAAPSRPETPAPVVSAPVMKAGAKLTTAWVRIVITGILLLAALYIILSKSYDGSSKNWAFGVMGTIVGYWLKPEKS